jgi:hypothetical protein
VEDFSQFLVAGLSGSKALPISLTQGRNYCVAVLFADFAVLVAVSFIEAGLFHWYFLPLSATDWAAPTARSRQTSFGQSRQAGENQNPLPVMLNF